VEGDDEEEEKTRKLRKGKFEYRSAVTKFVVAVVSRG